MGLFVINYAGRDKNQWFPDGPATPVQKEHPPINFHAYAACTNGAFLRDLDELAPAPQKVLLLLRPRHLAKIYKLMKRLQIGGYRVAVTLKETGSMQISEGLCDGERWKLFSQIVGQADAYIAPTLGAADIFIAAGAKRGEVIPTPYPIEFPEWNFGQFLPSRAGVIVGTREFATTSRRHLQALASLARAGIPATVINTEGRVGERFIREISGNFRVIEGPLPYVKYLRLMASHRAVFQLDASRVPGQVAGDALLCRMPCVGGNGYIENLTFPKFTSNGRTNLELIELLKGLLENDTLWTEATEESQRLGTAKIGFAAVAEKIEKLF